MLRERRPELCLLRQLTREKPHLHSRPRVPRAANRSAPPSDAGHGRPTKPTPPTWRRPASSRTYR
eukprot:5136993-Alexandrium_andersonii.AAC.1